MNTLSPRKAPVTVRIISNPAVISWGDGPFPGDVCTAHPTGTKAKTWNESAQKFQMLEKFWVEIPGHDGHARTAMSVLDFEVVEA